MYENDAFGVSAIDYVCTVQPLDGVNRLYLIPTPSGADEISYYYVSKRYVYHDYNYVSDFSGDDDTTLLDDDLVEQAALYRTLRILGLDYGEERLEFTKMLREQMAHDGGARVLNQARPSGSVTYTADMVLGANVPLTGLGE
jgi:hypothetical protein